MPTPTVTPAARARRIPLILLTVYLSGVWKPGIHYTLFGAPIALPNLVRDAVLLVIVAVSLLVTPKALRRAHHFEWGPMIEVAKLFAGIFVTIIPAIAMLRAGARGAFAPVLALVTDRNGHPIDGLYFWATGMLSSFLDNAPTYLVFFNLAGGEPDELMTTLASTLVAISAGAVFMGANTYIGNAPNFMVKAVAVSRGVPMPGFFGYMIWSSLFLLPIFGLLTLLFF